MLIALLGVVFEIVDFIVTFLPLHFSQLMAKSVYIRSEVHTYLSPDRYLLLVQKLRVSHVERANEGRTSHRKRGARALNHTFAIRSTRGRARYVTLT